MTNLKEVNFGLNQYCGPTVLSALTGESTDRCAAVISAVSGRQEIKAVNREHLKEALKRLRFDVSPTNFSGGTLFGSLHRMHTHDGLYIVFVPHHVVAVEVQNTEIFICDNHTKTPMDINQSARLMQKCEDVWEVSREAEPKFERTQIIIEKMYANNIRIKAIDVYENHEDNVTRHLGQFTFKDNNEMNEIISKLSYEVHPQS